MDLPGKLFGAAIFMLVAVTIANVAQSVLLSPGALPPPARSTDFELPYVALRQEDVVGIPLDHSRIKRTTLQGAPSLPAQIFGAAFLLFFAVTISNIAQSILSSPGALPPPEVPRDFELPYLTSTQDTYPSFLINDYLHHSRIKRTVSGEFAGLFTAKVLITAVFLLVAGTVVTIGQSMSSPGALPPRRLRTDFELPYEASRLETIVGIPPETASIRAGVALPGTPSGGLLPTGNSPDVLAGLALVPDGFTAVEIFPPTSNQQIPALTVIFVESERYELKNIHYE